MSQFPPVAESIRRITNAKGASGYVFDWVISVACNYRCPYCYYEGHWDDLKKHNLAPPLETALATWKGIYEKYGECYILINGGEPTVYPRFMELMAALTRWHRWNFNTNLTWRLDRWRAFAEQIEPSRGNIQFSFHPSEEKDIDAFIERALAVRRLGFDNCDVTIIAYPPHLRDLKRFCGKFKAAGIKVSSQPFVGTWHGKNYPHDYTEEESALIRILSEENDSSLRSELDHAIGSASPLGKLCRSGQYSCHINQMGEVYRCTQIDQSPGSRERLGHFYRGFELRPGPTPCPKAFCQCGESRWLVERCG
ncbi:MAG: radical SAM protein [Elusimicrobia bacterium]|nr:radical SAM protein [Elusimicrobiota bacterium]